MISLRHIHKRFGAVTALDDVSLDIGTGEVLALVGENGAGKSTLMNVLYGLYHADAGEVLVGGQPVRLKSPRDAIARGIGMVHQHFMLVPTLTVAENVVLGREPTRFGRLDQERACQEVAATCERFGFKLDPRARVDTLSVGSQQKVEIVKALHRGAQVLILDEPTAVLTPQESDDLFRVARGLAAGGRTVVFISHKLREVLSVAERVVVMRRGRRVAEVRAAETSAQELAALMVGDARALTSEAQAYHPPTGERLLETRELTARGEDDRPVLRGVSLEVHAGEIVGIAGVDGNGQREFAEVLTGLRKVNSGSGTILGGPLEGLTPAEARRRGVGHVPEDRLWRAVVKAMSVEENVALGRQDQAPFARGPRVDFEGRRERTETLLKAYDVRPPDPRLALQALSGGNQQKVVVARELDASPRLLVVVQPTRGLDIGAVAQVQAKLREARDRGAGVVLVSLDLEEVLALADRVYVFFEGRVSGTFTRPEFDEREIGRRMLGTGQEVAHG
ncbi:Ribose ABC transport system, ATP-binding protein RbsA [Cystobacter fuscus DSM 2262]|uniref:Ribose ABC transport system, ATP-binding protein RbsA n=1 Tax=Cystobacter fuscus (strain ATCC 25194 / DSM 2262 / NBRC 100088 / M29) TaxID=1242864 RepID=S9PKZ2_CYSF2|nr:Ribose ABC transport system, ATP-binding protein RbsA [Cystobacter fuscus DSM 2262]